MTHRDAGRTRRGSGSGDRRLAPAPKPRHRPRGRGTARGMATASATTATGDMAWHGLVVAEWPRQCGMARGRHRGMDCARDGVAFVA